MKRYWLFSTALVVIMLLVYGAVAYLGYDGLTGDNAPDWMVSGGGFLAALGGILLLIVDVVLPVPSSAIMIANGLLYGLILGTILSLIGTVGAAAIGYMVGQRGSQIIIRFITQEEMDRAEKMIARWGTMAVVSTRPIPMIAETTAIMAGASGMRWTTFLWASLIGSIPQAVLFAITGATAATLDNMLLAFGLSLLIAGLVWGIGKRYQNEVDAIDDPDQTVDDNSDPEQLSRA